MLEQTVLIMRSFALPCLSALGAACRPAQARRGRLRVWPIAAATLLLAGCLNWGGRAGSVSLDLTPFLPAEWQALGALQEINIDDDEGVEYLMLFTYDQSSGGGPVGALILDPQAEAIVTETGQRVAGRPAIFPNPYPILPSYWRGAGQGFIAAPNQRDAVAVNQVAYRGAGSGSQTLKPDTLILRGGNNYLTFVWWRNVFDGYGVAQLFAPGGFEGIDWAQWQREPAPILSIVGVAPRNDRSLLCHKTRYDLADPIEPDPRAYRQPIRFGATDLGIFFCYGPSTHPFYPEGVVLAYLRHPEQRAALLLAGSGNPQADETPMAEVAGLDALVRVDDVVGYQDIPLAVLDAAASANRSRTTVCAQVVTQPGGENAPLQHRRLLFALEHRPPQLDPSTPDRLYIATVEDITAQTGGAEVTCRQLIE